MSAIVKSLYDLVSSLFEVVTSLFTTTGHLAKDTFHFAFKFLNGAVNLVVDFFKGLVDLAGGIAGFILGNIAILAVLSVGFFAFLQYQRKQGNTVQVGNKKLN
ncbi:hypothetical protein DM02DRAFT_559894 [Periconia macrospinosa]|uniref:Uncharacterized protein n=1 Tax=Periconia macrospinosa TaxID=97972 RepID=A0A2V1DVS5_9PLEO|nr:hypothetical protein DM02DRAFT_559894 [Periconia macrospinosa]